LAVALALLGASAVAVAEEGSPPAFERLADEGRYSEAYEAAARNGAPPDAQALERLSRALLRRAVRSEDNYVRWFALRAMRTLEDRDLAAAVRPLADSGDRYLQALALEFLANADPQGSREVFLAALESPFRTVRLRALDGLGRLKDPTLAGRLGTVLVSDDDPEIRAFAARALGSSGSRQAVAAVMPGLDDANDLVREEAVLALVALGDEKIVDIVRERVSGAAPLERVRAIRLARLVADERIVQALGPLLGDGDPEVRAFAAGAILSIRLRLAGAK
jgi:HEAT repeat protein